MHPLRRLPKVSITSVYPDTLTARANLAFWTGRAERDPGTGVLLRRRSQFVLPLRRASARIGSRRTVAARGRGTDLLYPG